MEMFGLAPSGRALHDGLRYDNQPGKEKGLPSRYETEALSPDQTGRNDPIGADLADRRRVDYRRSRMMTSRIVSITSNAIGIDPLMTLWAR